MYPAQTWSLFNIDWHSHVPLNCLVRCCSMQILLKPILFSPVLLMLHPMYQGAPAVSCDSSVQQSSKCLVAGRLLQGLNELYENLDDELEGVSWNSSLQVPLGILGHCGALFDPFLPCEESRVFYGTSIASLLRKSICNAERYNIFHIILMTDSQWKTTVTMMSMAIQWLSCPPSFSVGAHWHTVRCLEIKSSIHSKPPLLISSYSLELTQSWEICVTSHGLPLCNPS